jgi:hypothetical protein
MAIKWNITCIIVNQKKFLWLGMPSLVPMTFVFFHMGGQCGDDETSLDDIVTRPKALTGDKSRYYQWVVNRPAPASDPWDLAWDYPRSKPRESRGQADLPFSNSPWGPNRTCILRLVYWKDKIDLNLIAIVGVLKVTKTAGVGESADGRRGLTIGISGDLVLLRHRQIASL